MKRGTQADQIVNDIVETKTKIEFLQTQLESYTDEKEKVYILDALKEARKKLHQLKNI